MKVRNFAGVVVIASLLWVPGTVAAELPTGVIYDEGYAWFEINSNGTISNNVVTERWSLEGRVRLFGTGMPEGSALRLVLKQNDRELARETIAGTSSHNRVEMRAGVAPDTLHAWFRGMDQALDASGEVTAEVYFINDDDDSETLVHTHTLDVRRLSRVRSSGQAAASHFFINRHGDAPVMMIQRVPRNERHYFGDTVSRSSGDSSYNEVYLFASRSFSEGASRVGQLSLRCAANGARVPIEQPRLEYTGSVRHEESVGEVRVVAPNRTESEYLKFQRFAWRMPLTFGDERHRNDMGRLDAHPGEWDCSIRTESRQTLRSFTFTVNPDGTIGSHPEEEHVSLMPGIHFVNATIPSDDNPLDGRTDPNSRTFFYGRDWQSDAGRTMAGAVPSIGEAFPPSGRSRPARARRGHRAR